MKLLYRDKKYIDESFPDYLMRMAYWNGFRSLDDFSKKLKEIYRSLYVNLDKGENSNITLFSFGRKHLGWLQCKFALEAILRRNFSLDEMNLSRRTEGDVLCRVYVCRACWNENPYIRFHWRLPSINFCYVHEVEMMFMHMTGYHPDVERFQVLKYGRVVYESKVNIAIRQILSIKHKTRCSLDELSIEIDIFDAESTLWPAVVSFLETRFLISFKFESVFELLDVNILCGVKRAIRLEMVTDMLIAKSDASEKLVKVVVLIFLQKLHLYDRNSYSWARAQTYSLSPLLDAYIFGVGVGVNLFYEQFMLAEDVVAPIYFFDFSDRMICQFIIDSGVFSHHELEELYTGGKHYSVGLSDSPDSIKGYKYKRYTDVVDGNIFDADPLPRESLGV